MRTLAWWHAAPAIKRPAGNNQPLKSRLLQYKESHGGELPEMPPVEFGNYLLDELQEVGPGVNGAPLTYSELKAWRDVTGTNASVREIRILRHLSQVYVAKYHEAGNPDCPKPWVSPNIDRVEVASGMKSLLGKIKKRADRRK